MIEIYSNETNNFYADSSAISPSDFLFFKNEGVSKPFIPIKLMWVNWFQ